MMTRSGALDFVASRFKSVRKSVRLFPRNGLRPDRRATLRSAADPSDGMVIGSLEESDMTSLRGFYLSTAAVLGFAALVTPPTWALAQATVTLDNDDIGGIVTGPNGAEAGVWVIAETTDLPTRFARMVVTDDQGRYVVPDLPKAKYKIWVRGYGLVDSAKVDGEPGQKLDLRAVPAPNEAAAPKCDFGNDDVLRDVDVK